MRFYPAATKWHGLMGSSMNEREETVAVVGGYGTVGRRLVAHLLADDAGVRALSHRPVAELPRMPGVHPFRADLTDAASVRAAISGCRRVFLIWPLMSTDPAPAVLQAVQQNGSDVVFVSRLGAAGQPAGEATGTVERLLSESGIRHVVLRCSGFAANALDWADQIQHRGAVRWVFPDAYRSPIHEADVAAVAANALRDPALRGGNRGSRGVHTLTGPQQLTQAGQLQVIGDAIGRRLQWEEAELSDVHGYLLESYGDRLFVADRLQQLRSFVSEPEPVTDDLGQLLGRPGHTFAEWAADHAEDFC